MSRSSRISATIAFLGCLLITRYKMMRLIMMMLTTRRRRWW